MAASPVQLTQEEAQPDKSGLVLSPRERENQEGGGRDVSLLNDIAAALNKNKTKPSGERKEKRKKWSFKRRKDSSSQEEGVGQVGGASEVPQQGKVYTLCNDNMCHKFLYSLEGRTLETEVKGDDSAGQMTMILEAEDVITTEPNVAKAAEPSQNHSPLPTPTPHTPTPSQPSPHRVRPRRKAPPPPQKVETTAHLTHHTTHCVCVCTCCFSLRLYAPCRSQSSPKLLSHSLNSPLPPHTHQNHPLPPHTHQRQPHMPNLLYHPGSQHTSPLNHPHLPSSQHMSPPHKPHLLPWAGHTLPRVRVVSSQLPSIGGSAEPLLVG